MPVYEYRCDECHERFEMRRSYAESDAPAACPTCHQPRTHRLLSNFVAMTASSNGGAATAVAGGGGCSGCAGGHCASCGD
jgi:putative FmdB family regulatory protein